MDTDALVRDNVDAGAALAIGVDAVVPVRSWFWIKEYDVGEWYFYLVSEQTAAAKAEARNILNAHRNAWLDPMQVRAITPDNPLAQAVIEIQTKYPQILPKRFRTTMLGKMYVGDSYIYPPAQPVTA
jgi:hypothetical protein